MKTKLPNFLILHSSFKLPHRLLVLLGKDDAVLQESEHLRNGTEGFDPGFKPSRNIQIFNRR